MEGTHVFEQYLASMYPNIWELAIIHCTSTREAIVYMSGYAPGDIPEDAVDGIVSAVEPRGVESRGILRLGLFSSSNVTPSSFVMPTTGGSPFLTNSYKPVRTELVIIFTTEGYRWDGYQAFCLPLIEMHLGQPARVCLPSIRK
jgi:hypothetical protein